MDLSAGKIIIFDLDDLHATNEAAALKLHENVENAIRSTQSNTATAKFAGVCLSQETILILVTFISVLTIMGGAFIVYFLLRCRFRTFK